MYIDDEQEQDAMSILLSSGAKICKEQPVEGAIFMTLKPTEDKENDVTNETD
jgi:hypothetical protein